MSSVISLAQIRARHEREKLVLSLLKQLEYLNLAGRFVREYPVCADRKWRLDLYCRDAPRGPLAIELHGGIWKGGRHVRGQGFQNDREKMNACVEYGIRVLEYTPREVSNGNAALQIERILKQ